MKDILLKDKTALTKSETERRTSNQITTAFLQRNYNPQVEENKKANKALLGKSELNSMLFRLKKYYNELHKERTANEEELNKIKSINSNLETKIIEIDHYKDMELPNEKISVKNIMSMKEPKEKIESRIHHLTNEKKNLEEKYKNELEYTNTIRHMIESEKQTLEKLNEVAVTTQNKITAIKYAKKNLDSNVTEAEKKMKNFNSVVKSLKQETDKLSELIYKQDEQVIHLDHYISQRQYEIQELKSKLEEMKTKDTEQMKVEKEKVLKEIKTFEENKMKKHMTESNLIKLVLGLDILRKYFIVPCQQEDACKLNDLTQSQDYQIFMSCKYSLYDDKDLLILNTVSSTGEDARSSNTCKIYLKDIKEKFDSLDIECEQLHDFYLKLMSRTNFHRLNMIKFNDKQILYENKKDKFSQKVKEIISKDYKNFDDLLRNNTRFENFMKDSTFTSLAHEMRVLRKGKLLGVNIEGKSDVFSGDSQSKYNDLYLKCHNLMSDVKAFLEFSINNLRGVLHKCENKEINAKIKYTLDLLKSRNNHFIKEDKTNQGYVEDLLKNATQDDRDIKELEVYLSLNTHAKNFYALNLRMEKMVYYFFNSYNTQLEAIYKTKDVLNYCYAFINDDESKLRLLPHLSSIQNRPTISLTDRYENKITEDKAEGRRGIKHKKTNGSAANSYVSDNYESQYEFDNKEPIVSKKSMRVKINEGHESDDSFQTNDESVNRYPSLRSAKQKQNNYLNWPNKNRDGFSQTVTSGFNFDKKIIQKLYEPHLKEKSYNINLNRNIGQIKKMTRDSSNTNYLLDKKKKEIEAISKDLILYNNPKINLDGLSNNTYNFFVKQIISKQLEINKSQKNEENLDLIHSVSAGGANKLVRKHTLL